MVDRPATPPASATPATAAPYVERRHARTHVTPLRGLRMHWREWLPTVPPQPGTPTLVMLHGWMDVAASFQFVVDALAGDRRVVSLDWRGFGGTASGADTFWFLDYVADLDAWLDVVSPGEPVDLAGHSMGGNVVMLYAGVRPGRVRRLVNLEGFGMPATRPEQSPQRIAAWLDELKAEPAMRTYASLDEVAARLMANNPLLPPDKAAWLAPHWAEARPDGTGGLRWHVLGEPAHKRAGPLIYRVEEVLATWRRITAPVLWIDGDRTDVEKWWGPRYPRSEFDARLAVVPQVERHTLSPCGHMLHHDQPEALAALLEPFLRR